MFTGILWGTHIIHNIICTTNNLVLFAVVLFKYFRKVRKLNNKVQKKVLRAKYSRVSDIRHNILGGCPLFFIKKLGYYVL